MKTASDSLLVLWNNNHSPGFHSYNITQCFNTYREKSKFALTLQCNEKYAHFYTAIRLSLQMQWQHGSYHVNKMTDYEPGKTGEPRLTDCLCKTSMCSKREVPDSRCQMTANTPSNVSSAGRLRLHLYLYVCTYGCLCAFIFLHLIEYVCYLMFIESVYSVFCISCAAFWRNKR